MEPDLSAAGPEFGGIEGGPRIKDPVIGICMGHWHSKFESKFGSLAFLDVRFIASSR